jgi:hypothetical protein
MVNKCLVLIRLRLAGIEVLVHNLKLTVGGNLV